MDYSEIVQRIKGVYAEERYENRQPRIRATGNSLEKVYRDEFYLKMIGEMETVQEKQATFINDKKNQGNLSMQTLMDGSLNDLIVNLLIQGQDREVEAKNLKK